MAYVHSGVETVQHLELPPELVLLLAHLWFLLLLLLAHFWIVFFGFKVFFFFVLLIELDLLDNMGFVLVVLHLDLPFDHHFELVDGLRVHLLDLLEGEWRMGYLLQDLVGLLDGLLLPALVAGQDEARHDVDGRRVLARVYDLLLMLAVGFVHVTYLYKYMNQVCSLHPDQPVAWICLELKCEHRLMCSRCAVKVHDKSHKVGWRAGFKFEGGGVPVGDRKRDIDVLLEEH